MVDCSSLKQSPCFQKTNFWQITEVIPLWFFSIRQEMGMAAPLSGAWQLHKKQMGPDRLFPGDGVSEAGSRDAWTTVGKAPAFKLGESRTLLTGGSILSQATKCPVCYVTVSKIVLWMMKYLARVTFDLGNMSCLYLVLTRTMGFFCFVSLCPSLNLQPLSCKRATSQIISYLFTLRRPLSFPHKGLEAPTFRISYKSFKTEKKLFSENTWNLNS